MEKQVNIRAFLDEDGKITALPRKHKPLCAVLHYLAEKFDADATYTEKQVNAMCDAWHTFGDYFLLRRELVDQGFLARERDGSRYWRVKEAQPQEAATPEAATPEA